MNKILNFFSINYFNFLTLYNIIFNSSYFPIYFIIHCFYVCYFLRIMTPIGGFHILRSLILGFILSYFNRFLFSCFLGITLPENEKKIVFLTFLIVWILMNIFPFDLIFKLLNITFLRIFLQISSSIGQSQLLINCLFNHLLIYPNDPSKALITVLTSFSIPIIIDYLDSYLYGSKINGYFTHKKKTMMLYPFHYIKRISFLTFFTLLLSQKDWILNNSYLIDLSSLGLPISILTLSLSLLDIFSHYGLPFLMFDFFFPKIFKLFFTFYPLN